MGEWKEAYLDELSDKITVGFVGKMADEYKTEGVTFLRSLNIKPFKIDTSNCKFISAEFNKKIQKSELLPGDIVIVRTGNPGTAALIPDDFPVANCSDVVIVRTGKELDKHFFLYYMNSIAKAHVHGHLVGAVQQHFNVKSAKEILVKHPPLPEQKAIAEVLSSLDDKIDLLRRQNNTLEQMAEALFRQRFVEEVGEDWEDGTLDGILSVRGGTTPSTKNPDFWNGNIHWTSPKDVTTLEGIYLFDTERKITDKGLRKISSGLLPKGTLLMSSRAPVGVLAFSKVPIAINQGYIAILDNKGFSKEYIYLWLKQNMESVHSHANGSTFMEISKSSFKSLHIVIPPEAKRNNFQELITPLFEKIMHNSMHIQRIEKLRDTLLPKLMSGEVKVDI